MAKRAGKNLSGRRQVGIDRSHATQQHGRVEKRIAETQMLEMLIPGNADADMQARKKILTIQITQEIALP